jgi:hypothetical protein
MDQTPSVDTGSELLDAAGAFAPSFADDDLIDEHILDGGE